MAAVLPKDVRRDDAGKLHWRLPCAVEECPGSEWCESGKGARMEGCGHPTFTADENDCPYSTRGTT